jgi:hypothetical protein
VTTQRQRASSGRADDDDNDASGRKTFQWKVLSPAR